MTDQPSLDQPMALDPEDYLRERYIGHAQRPRVLSAYYALKPILPPALRLAMRRLHARRRSKLAFPRWPIEPILIERHRAALRRRIRDNGGQPVEFMHFWPNGKRFASVLTHDVEGPQGIENIPRIREVERRYGFISAWYFVAEDYAIPDGLFDRLRDEGCEIGLHGIHHDGKLFSSRKQFESELPAIHRYLQLWNADGFRSPATHRNADWMPELGCLYDTSFSDTAPFEPQPGGCCSIHPYFLDDLVELPLTLTMDHTLWEILRDDAARHWIDKARWLIANNGLVNLLVHPDYVVTAARLAAYDEFLGFLASQDHGWHALPNHVARWWIGRSRLERGAVEGPSTGLDGLEPTIAHARALGQEIVYDFVDAA